MQKSNNSQYDSIVNKVERSLKHARKMKYLANKHQDKALADVANSSIENLKSLWVQLDAPMTWFQMEKGATYIKKPNQDWQLHSKRREPKRVNF